MIEVLQRISHILHNDGQFSCPKTQPVLEPIFLRQNVCAEIQLKGFSQNYRLKPSNFIYIHEIHSANFTVAVPPSEAKINYFFRLQYTLILEHFVQVQFSFER